MNRGIETAGLILLLLFTALMVIGINAGEPAVVWEKAVTLCLSCMGIN